MKDKRTLPLGRDRVGDTRVLDLASYRERVEILHHVGVSRGIFCLKEILPNLRAANHPKVVEGQEIGWIFRNRLAIDLTPSTLALDLQGAIKCRLVDQTRLFKLLPDRHREKISHKTKMVKNNVAALNPRSHIGKKEISMFMIEGGVYTNTDFDEIEAGTEESYGPFETYEIALREWRGRMGWMVDTCCHRLLISNKD